MAYVPGKAMKPADEPLPPATTITFIKGPDKETGSSAIYGDVVEKEEYSVFTIGQKRAIIVTASFAAWFSPLSGIIYYPATTQIAADLGVSVSKINITVMTYLIVQGLAPMMIAGFSDKAGRRPAYAICFGIYMIANLALSLQNSYVALLLLRMLQSAGSSGTMALADGVVGDCIVSSERGQYIAFASLGSILGPTLSPIIGGLLSQHLGWHWIFAFLLILSAVFCMPMMLFMPETCRKIVGNGSVPPPWTSSNLSDRQRFRNRASRGIPVDEKKLAILRSNYRVSIPNPISTLVVLADFETALILFATGFALALFYAICAGASRNFNTLYGLNDFQVALMFLPVGAGGIISAFTTGKLVDWNYRRHAKVLNFPLVKNRQVDLSEFPIEKARMQIALPMLFIAAASCIGYGWMLSLGVSLAGPVIMLFILGYSLIGGSQVLNVLMVDIYPNQPATATAANNLVRCLLGAAASAAIIPLSDAIGTGWAHTLLSFIFLLSSTGPVLSMRYGISWRKAKKDRAEMKQKNREAKAEEEERGRKAAALLADPGALNANRFQAATSRKPSFFGGRLRRLPIVSY